MIGILDIGIGNVMSLYSVIQRLNIKVKICKSKNDLDEVKKIIFPGQGSFGEAMNKLRENEIDKHLLSNISVKKKPFLGICVGMQLLFKIGYEYGEHQGLGLFDGVVKKIYTDEKTISLPHIGWNSVSQLKKNSLFNDIDDNSDFYFAHSNYIDTKEKNIVLGQTFYGIKFPSIIVKENIIGLQFHLEKSQLNGFKLLKEFILNFDA